MKRTSLNSANMGQEAEIYAEQYLINQGLTFRQRNFSKPCGEIDLIMQDRSSLVFVEVKLRKQGQQVSVLESINRRKQQRLIKTAHWYLQSLKLGHSFACRFDVIAIEHDSGENAALGLRPTTLEWIKNAFFAN